MKKTNKPYTDLIRWNGDNKEQIYSFLLRHKLELGIKNNLIIDIQDNELFIKNINLHIKLYNYLMITKDKKLKIKESL